MKKLIITLFLLPGLATQLAALPTCPSMPVAAVSFSNLSAVTQSQGPAGYQLSQHVVGTDGTGVTTSYNYYSQTNYSPADALQQIHILGSLLNAPAREDDYQLGNVQYKQCVYWNTMSGNGIPSGNQVLSIQYSQNIAPTTGIHNIIVFGDSLTDIGNAGIFTNAPKGVTNRIWIQDLVSAETEATDNHQIMKSKAFETTSAQQGQSPNDDNIDYAYGGATASPGRPLNVPSVGEQIGFYVKDLGSAKPDPNTYFFIWAGGNDLLTQLAKVPSQDALNTAASSTVVALQQELSQLTNTLNVPANHIILLNLPNLGRTPLINKLPIFPQRYAEASEFFNSKLQTMLQTQYPDASKRPVLIDIHSHLASIMNDPSKYGFDNVTVACSTTSAKPNCDKYLFWDPVHPTTVTHLNLAKFVEDNL